MQGSQPPHPPCPKEELEPLSKPLANRWQEDVTDYGGKPPCVRGLVWLAKPVPLRGEPWSFYRLRMEGHAMSFYRLFLYLLLQNLQD